MRTIKIRVNISKDPNNPKWVLTDAHDADMLDGRHYDGIRKLIDDVWKIAVRNKIELELMGRLPGGEPTIFDTMDEGNQQGLSIDRERWIVGTVTSVGSTSLDYSGKGKIPVGYYYIYDDTNMEEIHVSSSSSSSMTLQSPTKYKYKSGANVASSNTKIKDGNTLIGDWETIGLSM